MDSIIFFLIPNYSNNYPFLNCPLDFIHNPKIILTVKDEYYSHIIDIFGTFMIDMLVLTSPNKISSQDIEYIRNKYNLSIQGVPDTNYRKVKFLSRNKKIILRISTSAIRKSMDMSSISINPKHYSGHQEVVDIVCRLLKSQITIRRIDLCSDLPISINDLEPMLRVKYKQKYTEFERAGVELTGFYYGKNTEVIAVYDKSRELQKFQKFQLSKIKNKELKNTTRIEVRLTKNKIPEKKFELLCNYVDYNPYKNTEIIDIESCKNERILKRQRFNQFREIAKEFGLNKAYKIYNQSNNFTKTIRKYLSPSHLYDLLIANYINNLKEYLGK